MRVIGFFVVTLAMLLRLINCRFIIIIIIIIIIITTTTTTTTMEKAGLSECSRVVLRFILCIVFISAIVANKTIYHAISEWNLVEFWLNNNFTNAHNLDENFHLENEH